MVGSAVLGYRLARGLGVYAETFAAREFGHWLAVAGTGIGIMVGPDVQFDVGLETRLAGPADRFGLVAGITVRP